MDVGLAWTANRFSLFDYNTEGAGEADFNWFHLKQSAIALGPVHGKYLINENTSPNN